MRRLILIVLLILLLVACGTPTGDAPTAIPSPAAAPTAAAAADPCATTDLRSYRTAYNNILGRWGVALVAASKARPEDLKTPIEQLQAISGELTALKPPLCAQQANAETAQAMQQIIQGYQNLMASKQVGEVLKEGIDMLALSRDKVNALPGTLAPTPTFVPTVTSLPTQTPTPTMTPTSTSTATPTPAPRAGVIVSKVVQVYDSPTSITPIKSLVRGTRVTVFELQRGRLHIRAGRTEGWVSQGAVVIQ